VDRREFIIYWARYVKMRRDEEWSEQQRKLIDSQIKSVREFYRKNPEIAKRVLERYRQGSKKLALT
jgi:hypothetical protein